MTEGKDDLSAAPAPSPGSTSPTGSAVDTGQVPKEKPEETEAAVASEEEGAEGTAEAGGGGGGDGEHLGALGIGALPGSCCVCIEMDQINNCLHSEKICILPILACLLSLALCTAGLKWVFVDKIFEYDPPTHLDPKRIGQDPVILSVDPTLAPTASTPHPATSAASSTSSGAVTPGLPDVLVEDKSTRGPQSDVSFTLRHNAEKPATLRPTPRPQTTPESNYIITPTISASRTTSTTKTSSHVTRCRDSQRNYCVNGGECFTLEIMPGSTKFLCRCPNEFTGDRCQNYVMATFYKAEELYQKRILTITGICIALLVVGIMCVVGYCKTKKRRKELHDRLRQSLRKKRNNNNHTGVGPNTASSARGCQSSNLPLQDLQLINQRNGTILPHSAEKETETTFSSTPYDLSVHEPTTFTNISNQRLVSAASRTSLETPGSPPSEMSAPLSSLAISVPSVALSPSGEEERPLLLSNTQKSSSRGDQKRNSAHYNHGHVAHSLPPSPLLAAGGGNFQMTGERDATSASASPETLAQGAGLANGNFSHNAEPSSDAVLRRETEGALGQRPPLATAESMTALLLRAMYSRTHPAPTGSPILDPVTV